MINKDIEILNRLYLKGWITKEEYLEKLEELEGKDKPDIKEPPIIY